MSVSFGSCLSGLIATVFLSIYGSLSLKAARRSVYWDLRVLVLLFIVAGMRMLLPVNLPVNISIYSHKLLVPASNIVFLKIPHTDLFLAHFLVILLFTFSAVLLIRRWIRMQQFRRQTLTLSNPDDQLTELLSKRLPDNKPPAVTAVYIDGSVSPFVFGAFHPVIAIPKGIYTENELEYILDHELVHIRQHDLLLKDGFGLLAALFWWNPFMWILQREMDHAIELSNDVTLFQKMNDDEKLNYASLLVKTARLADNADTQHSLSLSTHNNPTLQRRVKEIIESRSPQKPILALHLSILLLITGLSFLVTPEPSSTDAKAAQESFSLEEDLGATTDNTYILDKGDHYELYVEGELIGQFQEIKGDLKGYPVYTEEFQNSTD